LLGWVRHDLSRSCQREPPFFYPSTFNYAWDSPSLGLATFVSFDLLIFGISDNSMMVGVIVLLAAEICGVVAVIRDGTKGNAVVCFLAFVMPAPFVVLHYMLTKT